MPAIHTCNNYALHSRFTPIQALPVYAIADFDIGDSGVIQYNLPGRNPPWIQGEKVLDRYAERRRYSMKIPIRLEGMVFQVDQEGL